ADAEDAFQAAFLVLIRKAGTIMPRERLASWLYGTTYLAALKARALAARRRAREKQVRDLPEPATVAEGIWHDLQPLLDRELNRLGDRYRLPLVLCDLEGRTRKEAAEQLGWPEGTVAGRLARGRALLAKRLTRLGLPASAGTLAVMLPQHAAATVPAALVTSMARAAELAAAARGVGAVLCAPAAA